MNINNNYETWLSNIKEPELVEELIAMGKDEIHDAFYRNLEFGTGGLRGIIGAGTNRMNIYTVAKVTQGLCNYLNSLKKEDKSSVAIAYDSRINSLLFARTAAEVIAANGLTAFIYEELMPTPMLSYAVRTLSCDAGIVITASHNPAQYNGYKVYGSDGCQITLNMANEILSNIESVDVFKDVRKKDFEIMILNGSIRYIQSSVIQSFMSDVKNCSINSNVLAKSGLEVIYTPLNGAGNKPVRSILNICGLKAVTVVPEQELPNGNFTTCKKPNPEERAAFDKALELAKVKPADILLATDPDCDRVGIAVRNRLGEYELLTGNETGCLLLNYILSQKKANGTMPKNPVVIKTIVTSALTYAIAACYGARVIDTLTGFKFIGEQIGELEAAGEAENYVFGFEESYGYLPGTYVRDKDAVAGSMLICEMAAFYKMQGINLIEMLEKLYLQFGCYRHKLVSYAFDGADGPIKMQKIVSSLRANDLPAFAGLKVIKVDDYFTSISIDKKTKEKKSLTLPVSDVIVLKLENECELVMRPSGTEPKFKCYITAKGNDIHSTDAIIEAIHNDVTFFVNKNS